MVDLLDVLRDVVDALDAHGVPYALCGGLAVVVHGHVRTTTDIDILVPEASLETAFAALAEVGFDLRSGRMPFAAGTPSQRVVHRVSRAGGPELLTVDLLAVTPVFEDVWRGVQTVDWNGTALRVVSASGLATMKRLAGRHQDLADLENLGYELSDDGDDEEVETDD